MGLRCLLGHDFGEPETERQRNEEGNEVVVTVREVKTCQTCGETRVVSENKEIKSIEQLRRSAMGDEGDRSAYGDSGGQTTGSESPYSDGVSGSADQSTSGRTPRDQGGAGPATSPDQQAGTADQSGPEGTPGSTGPVGDAATGPVQSGDEDAGGIADAIQDAEGGADAEGPVDAGRQPQQGDDDTGDVGDDADRRSPAAEPSDDEEAPSHPGTQEPPEPEDQSADPAEEDAVILDDDTEDAPAEAERKQWEETADPDEIPGRDEPEPEPDGDDAVIMDADATEDAAPERTEDGYTPWPKQHAEDEGHDAGIPDDEPSDVEFGGGLTPSDETAERAETDADDAHEGTAETPDPDRSPVDEVADVGRTAADSARNGAEEETSRPAPERTIDLERSAREARLEYHCPDCGLTRTVGNSSMRAGDICPECHRGYITERQKQN